MANQTRSAQKKNIAPVVAGVALGTAAIVAGVALSKKGNRDKLAKAAKGAIQKGKEFTADAVGKYKQVEQRMVAAKGGKAASHSPKRHAARSTAPKKS